MSSKTCASILPILQAISVCFIQQTAHYDNKDRHLNQDSWNTYAGTNPHARPRRKAGGCVDSKVFTRVFTVQVRELKAGNELSEVVNRLVPSAHLRSLQPHKSTLGVRSVVSFGHKTAPALVSCLRHQSSDPATSQCGSTGCGGTENRPDGCLP